MRSRISLRSVLLAPLVLLLLHAPLLLPRVVSAAPHEPDTTVTVSTESATRATGISEPVPPGPVDLGAGRIVIAPTGAGPGEQFGVSVASAGDVNADGYVDVIVGAWTSDAFAGDAGSAYVYYGGPGADNAPDLELHGQSYKDNFGTSVASAGDVNGDGYGDLIVGAWRSVFGSSETGRAYVYYGGPGVNAVADLMLLGEGSDDRFGVSVSSAGDVNGDGFADVIVGAPQNDGGGTDAGRAYVYFGGSAPNPFVDFALTGAAPGDRFGYAVSAAGDLNADGFADLVVGAYESGGTGRAYVFYGGPNLDTVPDRILTGEAQGDRFGISVSAAGDVNGDGYADLIVSADRNDAGATDAGRAYVFYGGPGFDATPDLVLTSRAAGEAFGQSVASAGDLNSDGFGDLIVGATLNDVRGPNTGRAYVYFGGPAADDVPDVTLTGEAPGDRFGNSVARAGDLDADGTAEVIVGAYFNDAGGGDAGRAYVVTFSASVPPIVTAPAAVAGTAEAPISFIVTASDPDGEAISSLTAAPLPQGATFTPNETHTSGAFLWLPGPGQTGSYLVTFAASNDLRGYALTRIVVANAPPRLAPVADMAVGEGATADQVLYGSDPDGDALTFGLSTGPGFASVSTIDATRGNLHLAPTFSEAGSYAATVEADDGHGHTAAASLAVIVNAVNRPPVMTVPAGVFGAEGVLISVPISATDPDGDRVTLGALNRPVGSLFIDFGTGAGSFSWTPGFGQAGTYTVTFTARDALGGEATPQSLAIVVDDVSRSPTADPGGPYAGVVSMPITFDGTGSSDPDGSALTYLWSFGDLVTASGVTPTHSYATGGTFVVILTVNDGGLSDQAATIATIRDVFPARVFATSSNSTIRLGSGKATWCAEIEPVEGAFLTTAVIPSTVAMRYASGQILAQVGKVSIGADKDANGIDELTTCFSKIDLRTLFAGLPKGTNTLTVTLEGELTTGGKFRGLLTIDVVSSGGALAASLSPNPLNPAGTLTFFMSRGSHVKVTVFDPQGRLVRTLEPGVELGAGYHDYRLDGRGDTGERLPSGVYYYRIEAAEGTETGRFVIAR